MLDKVTRSSAATALATVKPKTAVACSIGSMPSGSDSVFQWPRPDGAPERNADWASAARMLSSFRMHWDLASGSHPSRDVHYRKPQRWLPEKSLRLDRYVDHLARTLLGRRSTKTQLKAVCQATGFKPDEKIDRRHPLARGDFVRVAAVLLDAPAHMTR